MTPPQSTPLPATDLYRKNALQQQAAVRAHNDGLVLVGPGARLAAYVSLAVSLVGLVFATLISVPITVEGRGILLEHAGVATVSADTDGRISRLLVREGSTVRKGDVVAEVAQADGDVQLLDARQALRSAQTELARMRETIERTRSATALRQAQRRASAERQLAIEAENLRRLTKRQAAQEKLAKDGFISPMSLIDGEQDIIASKRRIDELRQPLEDDAMEQSTRAAEDRQRLTEYELRAREAQQRLAEQESVLQRTTHVLARADGVVASLRVAEGDVVGRQSDILTLIPERDGRPERLVAHFFVPGETGTQVRTGMAANVVPTSLSPQEYGYMRGKVAHVSPLPVASDDLEELLRNRDLVQQIMQNGVPIQTEVELEPGDAGKGYRWTASQGPSADLGHGTQLNGRIEIRRERLIVVVLPFLKRFFP